MIAEFKSALEALVRKKGDLNTLITKLKALLEKHPQLADPIETQLKQLANKNKISKKDYQQLHQVLAGQDLADEKTVVEKTEGVEDEKTLVENTAATRAVGTDATGASEVPPARTQTGMTSPTQATPMSEMKHGGPLIPGRDTLRHRFALDSKLGEGGMGTVYKAKDLIKVEARDKNPWLAVKVLNETFKQYKESFIALQRESSKAMRLAHPNIATVFDFDRDYDRDTVFMTMELLEGEPLNKVIRRLPPGGLSWEEAKSYIQGMSNGLAYAHHHNLVHSDFKPGNCFLNKQGVLKIMDFGIARAAKPAGTDAKGETTLFDPGTLGALTPAYASTEMLEGEDPETTDDIYALACVTYELLAGKHPYNKMPANQARDNKLKPATIKKLKSRQMKGILRGLEFSRKKRTPTVEQFLDEVTPKPPIALYVSIAATVLLAGFGLLAWPLYQDYKLEQRNLAFVDSIIATDQAKNYSAMAERIETLKTFDRDSTVKILQSEGVDDAILNYVETEALAEIDKAKDKYNYPEAERILKKAREVYEDSGRLDKLDEEVKTAKTREILAQRDLYSRFVKLGELLPIEGPDNDISDVMNIVRKVDPQNELLTNIRLIGSFVNNTRSAREGGDLERASALIKAGFGYDAKDTALVNENDQLQQALFEDSQKKKVAAIEANLAKAGIPSSIVGFDAIREDLIELRRIQPDHPALKTLTPKLAAAIDKAIGSPGSDLAQADTLLTSYAAVLDTKSYTARRTQLDKAWNKKGGVSQALKEERAKSTTALQQQLDAEIAKKAFTPAWSQTLKHIIANLELMASGKQDTALKTAQDQLAGAHLDQAAKMREQERFFNAEQMLAYAKGFNSQLPGIGQEQAAINKALEAAELARLEKIRIARITALKQDLVAKAQAEDIKGAKEFLEELKVELPPNHPYLTIEGPEAIAGAYAKQASRSFANAKRITDPVTQKTALEQAAKIADKGLVFTQELESLSNIQNQIQVALLVLETRQAFNADTLEIAALNRRLREIRRRSPDTFAELQRELTELVVVKISNRETYDPAGAGKYLADAKKLPLDQRILAKIKITPIRPNKYVADIKKFLRENKLTQAGALIAKSDQEDPGHPTVKNLRTTYSSKIQEAKNVYTQYQVAVNKTQRDQAKALINEALKLWVDNRDYLELAKSIKEDVDKAIIISRARCLGRYAGYGKRSRAQCYDMVAKDTQGPKLVVIPAGAGTDKPFAIGRSEVTVADWNNYCSISGKCQSLPGDSALPATGVSLASIDEYIAWLNKTTGANYRLPSAEEWTYAAEAQGKQPRGKSWNCLLRIGENIIKGTQLVPANSGAANGWGLVNYIGNAQELVTGGKARGGAYRNTMSDCKITLEKANDGSGDEITGFRLIRDIS